MEKEKKRQLELLDRLIRGDDSAKKELEAYVQEDVLLNVTQVRLVSFIVQDNVFAKELLLDYIKISPLCKDAQVELMNSPVLCADVKEVLLSYVQKWTLWDKAQVRLVKCACQSVEAQEVLKSYVENRVLCENAEIEMVKSLGSAQNNISVKELLLSYIEQYNLFNKAQVELVKSACQSVEAKEVFDFYITKWKLCVDASRLHKRINN